MSYNGDSASAVILNFNVFPRSFLNNLACACVNFHKDKCILCKCTVIRAIDFEQGNSRIVILTFYTQAIRTQIIQVTVQVDILFAPNVPRRECSH